MTIETQRSAHRAGKRARLAYIVEDDVATLGLLADLLEYDGWQVRLFTHLTQLRRALSQRVPDLLLLDDDLPDGRGGDEARELRRQEATRHVPILFCTAAVASRRREIGRLAAVLPKPFDLDRLDGYLRDFRNGGSMNAAGA